MLGWILASLLCIVKMTQAFWGQFPANAALHNVLNPQHRQTNGSSFFLSFFVHVFALYNTAHVSMLFDYITHLCFFPFFLLLCSLSLSPSLSLYVCVCVCVCVCVDRLQHC